MPNENTIKNISKQALLRLPYYLSYLKKIEENEFISAPRIALDLGLNDVQVRKDLAAVSSCGGKPKIGYEIRLLICDIEKFLGYDNVDEAILVGVGKLGSALLHYDGFKDYGIEIVAAFDNDEFLTNNDFKDKKPVFSMDKLKDLCQRMKIHIGIITVPSINAQEVCNNLVSSGILAILNFSGAHLSVPPNVIVQNENIASSLAVLSSHLRKSLKDQNN
ncbi:MAG: redox-sensing transcriptional repressor Rex [Oscillospiraceae bacterium]